MNKLQTILLVSMTVIISIVISSWVVRNQHKIYSVNLGRIMQTQMMIAGRMAANGINKNTWMMTIKDTSENIRKVIQTIAGNHVVIVSPAIVQGTVDITDQVLKLLNLPTNLPTTTLSQAEVIPSLIPRDIQAEPVSNKEKPKTSWLLP